MNHQDIDPADAALIEALEYAERAANADARHYGGYTA